LRISVIIPAYNAAPYIAEAIASCLNQTSPPYEIIVVDDGSTDDTASIAATFSPPVRVIRQKNAGVSAARNLAVESSTGDWIAFLDADDWFYPRKLELQQRCAQHNPDAVLIYTGVQRTFLDGQKAAPNYTSPEHLESELRYRCPFHICSVIMRREAFDAVGGFDLTLRGIEDWDLWLRLAARFSVKTFAAESEPLVAYRNVPGSLSSNAMRMFKARMAQIETRSLYGVSGLRRFFLRRRIRAFHHYDTSIMLREEGSVSDLSMILKSFVLWPLPGTLLLMKRYKVAAAMLKQHLSVRNRNDSTDTLAT
jgi:glycosyltransferase involved in cell wall biosynthesis